MLVDNAHNFPQDWLDLYINRTAKVGSDYDVKDNNFLVANNPSYIEALDSLPHGEKIPLEGRWVL